MQEGFWLPLAAEIAELSEDDAEDAADRLVHSSLLRVLDRERRRFQLHALLREQVRAVQGDDGLVKLKERHAAALEKLFKDWETRWQECRECLEEIIPAAGFLSSGGKSERAWQLSGSAYELGRRIGDSDAALRIMQHEKSLLSDRTDDEAKLALQHIYSNYASLLLERGSPLSSVGVSKDGGRGLPGVRRQKNADVLLRENVSGPS